MTKSKTFETGGPKQTREITARTLVGTSDRLCNRCVGFQMKLRGRDIAVGNGIDGKNGFLDRAVIEQWGVRSYAALWGESGTAISLARGIMTA